MTQTVEQIRNIALVTASHGRELAAAIDDAIFAVRPDDAAELTLYAERIRQCSGESNIWYAEDLHKPDGECFNGAGRFWYCGLRLCTSCAARHATRNRLKLIGAVNRQKLLVNEHWKFITFTIVNPNLPILETRKLFETAWALFRKSTWFRSTIRGLSKNEEFTVTAKGIHYHLHALAKARYIHYDALRHHWTRAVTAAFAQAGRTLEIATADRMLIVKCKTVTSMRKAIKEVCKYITKSDSWSKIPPTDLLDIARIRRFPRMFELMGDLALERAETPTGHNDDLVNETIVHTTDINDERQDRAWRDFLKTNGFEAAVESLLRRIHHSYKFRTHQLKQKYPYANFKRINAPRDDARKRLEARARALNIITEPRKPETIHEYIRRDDIIEILN